MSFWINAAFWAIIIGVGMWVSKPKRLTATFIVSLYVGLETYLYVSDWLPYLPLGLHILFYAIPASIFFITVLFYKRFVANIYDYLKISYDVDADIEEAFRNHKKWADDMRKRKCWLYGVIFSVWLSFPTVFMFYDWQDAKEKYESEMEELFGDEWEDEVEEMEQERFYRR